MYFEGVALVISHERYFLDRICTHIMSFESDNKFVFFEGSYYDYEAYKKSKGYTSLVDTKAWNKIHQ